ncbi:MAG: three-Cys-motif partner protein TcmP [Geminicoccaceae bacterium]
MAEALTPQYECDEDGYLREIVGPWVQDKHVRLARYIRISRSVRAKFIGKAGATFIDLYSGPGRVRARDQAQATHGSPLVAWHEAVDGCAAFTQIHVADDDPELSDAVEARLKKARAPVLVETGPATITVDRVISKLSPHALHFTFLDPYNLKSLPFDIIRKLARLKRMDILIHVSLQDLQRNLQRYIDTPDSALDLFAPGWRAHVDISRPPDLIRPKFLEYWRSLLREEGMATTETAELIIGSKKQRLYLLAFAARHERALEFWEKVRSVDANRQLSLL